MNELLTSIYSDQTAASISFAQFAASFAVSMALGLMIAAAYMRGTRYTKSFVATLAMLPAIICVIIMMVNGSVGAGGAVAGTFSLVRFRSAPGTAKEITAIFLSMATGIICGMGYFLYAGIFTAVICLAMILIRITDLGKGSDEKELIVSIPENLNYEEVFEDIFREYTSENKLISVKTSDMGSIFRLKYTLTLNKDASEKDFIDKIRVRNGNLPITICAAQTEDLSAQL